MFNGIEIDDTILLVYGIISSFFLLVTVAAAIIAFLAFYNKGNVENSKRIKRLREKAISDHVAEKRLKKLERKHKRNLKKDRWEKLLLFSVILVLFFVNVVFCVIPLWTDYIKKDYIVYSGNFSVERNVTIGIKYSRYSYDYILEDGTELSGNMDLDVGEYNKTLVYSKRTKKVLGISQNSNKK